MKTSILSRIPSLMASPELLWVVAYGFTLWMCSRNQPATVEGSMALEKWWWFIPLIFIPAGFAMMALHGKMSGWFLFRIDLASLVGLVACASKITSAIDYHDSRNSGTFAGWFMSILLGMFLLILGNVGVGFALWRMARKAGVAS